MVQINRNVGNLNLNSQITAKTLGGKEILPTMGNNTKATPSAIIGGDGSKGNPYILDGKDFDEDAKYLQMLADKYDKNIYFEMPGYTGHAFPDK